MSLEIPAEKRLIRKLEAVGYFLYVKSVDSSNTFISSMTCLSMMFFAVSPETACAMADRKRGGMNIFLRKMKLRAG